MDWRERIYECFQVPGHRYFYRSPSGPDHNGRVPLVCIKDTSRGYLALPSEFREVTDRETLDAIEYFRLRRFKA